MSRVTVEIPEHDPEMGLPLDWEAGSEIAVGASSGEVYIRANTAGLISLARHLLALAQNGVRQGTHVHLTADQEIDSEVDLILERD